MINVISPHMNILMQTQVACVDVMCASAPVWVALWPM